MPSENTPTIIQETRRINLSLFLHLVYFSANSTILSNHTILLNLLVYFWGSTHLAALVIALIDTFSIVKQRMQKFGSNLTLVNATKYTTEFNWEYF